MKKIIIVLFQLIVIASFGQRKLTVRSGTSGGAGSSTTTVVYSDTIRQRVYNVKQYGAISDGVTDATPAIQLTVNTCAANGGGEVLIPSGIYAISGALQTSIGGKNPNCQIYIPLTSSSDSMVTVKITGEVPPPITCSASSGFPMHVSGTILKSTILGSGASPSVIGSTWATTEFGGYNFTHTVIENITVRTRTKTAGVEISSQMSGINLWRMQTASMTDVRIDTESELFNSLEPHPFASGLITPAVSNAAWCYFERVLVYDYYNGIVVSEHANLVNVAVFGCYNGLKMEGASHNAVAERALIQWCRNNLYFNGRIAFWGTIDTENYTNEKWFKNVYDCVNNTGAKIEASVVFNRVVSGTQYTYNTTFNQSGVPINAIPLGRDIMYGVNGSATLDFPSTPAQSSSELTFSILWAAEGEPAVVTPNVAAYNANSTYTARVIQNNLIGVTFHNYSSQAINPASAIFKVSVIKN